MAVRAKTVAVIGAGPAGAIATDALVREQAFDSIKVFERRTVIGGAWVYTPHLPAGIPSLGDIVEGEADPAVEIPASLPAETPKSAAVNSHQHRYSDTPQHENLHSNIDPRIMPYARYPFPRKASPALQEKYGPDSPYHDREAIRSWIEDIFHRNGNEKLVELNTTVELAEKKGNKWVLTLREELPNSNYWRQETFDAVVVASGHYNIPWIPPIPGLIEYDARFPGRIVHSKHFREGGAFRGKKVIVVGASVSSSEILHEILPFAQHPVIASLRGPPIPAFGLIPWEHPHVVVKKHITQLDPQSGRIFFGDGTWEDDVDRIVLGTGYTFSLPFLPKVQAEIRSGYRRLPGVYQHTWNIEDPSLVFVGMLGGGFTFKVYEWQAVAVARYLAGRAKLLPSIQEQKEWESERVALHQGGKAYYSIGPNFRRFFEFLRDIAGPATPGTNAIELPEFDDRWLDIWAGMVTPKIDAWVRARLKAEAQEKSDFKAKL